MEEELKLRKQKIRSGARAAFIFVVFTVGVSQILSMILPFVPSRICEVIGMILGTVVVLNGSCKPENGTLFQEKNKLSGTGFVVLLGAFMAAKLLSLIPSAALLKLFVNEENAGTLQGLDTIGDSVFLSFIFLGVVTPFCEEAVFRGCIGNAFKKYGIWFAMLMSTLFFSLYHCNLFQLVSTFLPGIVLFYVAMNYSIKWSMLFHFINNGVLTVGFIALNKIIPNTFIADYGEYIIEAVLVIAALYLLKKDHAFEKVKSFLLEPKNEKGVYRAAMGNIWFILLILALVIVTAMMLLMLNGSLPDVSTIS